MKESLLQYLACPTCGGNFSLAVSEREGAEILSGEFRCIGCDQTFPVSGGIPRFADVLKDEVQRETAENFGAQWLEFDHVQQHHEQQFLDWVAPVTPEFVRGKTVVEGGCGKGRHTCLVGEWGARDVVGVDLSVAVE